MSGLDPLRQRLDRLDRDIVRLLGERFDICREVARYKRRHGIPMMQPDRVVEVRALYLARGAEAHLPPHFAAELFELLIGATCRMEDEIIAAGELTADDVSADGEVTAARLRPPGGSQP